MPKIVRYSPPGSRLHLAATTMHGSLVPGIVLLSLCSLAASFNPGRDDSAEFFTVIHHDDRELERHGVLSRIVGGRTATNLTSQGKEQIMVSSSNTSRETAKTGQEKGKRNETQGSSGRWQDQTRRNETWKENRQGTQPNRTTWSPGKPGSTTSRPPKIHRAPPVRSDHRGSGNKPQGSAGTGVIRPEEGRPQGSSTNSGGTQPGHNAPRYDRPGDQDGSAHIPESSRGVNSHGGVMNTADRPSSGSDGALRPPSTFGNVGPSNAIPHREGGSGSPSSSGSNPGGMDGERFHQNDGVTGYNRPGKYGGESSGPGRTEDVSPHRGHTDGEFQPERTNVHGHVRPFGTGSGYNPPGNGASHPMSPVDHNDRFGTDTNDGRALPSPDSNSHQHPHYNRPQGEVFPSSGAALPSNRGNPVLSHANPSGTGFNVPHSTSGGVPSHPGVLNTGVVNSGIVPSFAGGVNTGTIPNLSSQPSFGVINPQAFGIGPVSPEIDGIQKAVAETADAIRKAAQGSSVGFGNIDLDVAESRPFPFIYGR